MKKSIIIILLFFLTILLPGKVHSCSVFQTTDEAGTVRCGRNFDWSEDGGTIWFVPPDSENHGFLVIEQEGFDYPYEGMNDQGLFIAIAAVPKTKVPFSILKPIRVSCEMVTIILEKASSVEEAIPYFHKFSIAFGTQYGYPLIHYMIVDKEGRSAIVEFVDNKIVVTRNTDDYQAMTNFYVSAPELSFSENEKRKRYQILTQTLAKEKSSQQLVWQLLDNVSQKSTVWSNVYDLDKQLIYISYKGNDVVVFSLKDQLYTGAHGYDLRHLANPTPLSLIKDQSNLLIRPTGGYGFIGDQLFFHAGARILLQTGENQRYGLDVTYFDRKGDKFFSVGIVLEQILWGWFNSSIGTIGYFHYGKDNESVFGITSNLGWEPDNHIPIHPFITWRNDIIFGKNIENVNSISAGFDFYF